jgi:sterol desaturase/sphingolipid hydroxylase (fatty acid hydroxylase superfamily)
MEYTSILDNFLSDFIDPKKRIFLGYLGLSIIIAYTWLILVRQSSLRIAHYQIFNRKIFFSKSAQIDYKLFFVNRAFSLLISPLLITQIAIATFIYYVLHRQNMFYSGQFSDFNKTFVVALFSMSMFVADDFTKYFLHRWMHRWPLLWAFHKVHHSAETMTPITVYRVHPAEGILYGLRSAVTQGIVISTFVFAFGNVVDLYTIIGVNILVFFFHIAGSNLRHSHISIGYWKFLEHVFISPAQHQLHHSIAEEHHDKNFGAALAIWDWLFGSLHLSDVEKNIIYGLSESDSGPKTISDMYFKPFKDIKRILLVYFKKIQRDIFFSVD